MSIVKKHYPRIVYMGTPLFAVTPLKLLIESGYNVVGVVTNIDKPSGRGLKITESPVKQYINSLSESEDKPNMLQPTSLKDPLFLKELASFEADIFIVVAFRMLPREIWSMSKRGTFNLHTSLLPQYRGAAPINWAIINGESKSGVTTFLIDDTIDTGAILLQRECPIDEKETAESLHNKLMMIGSSLIIDTVTLISSNSFTSTPQDSGSESNTIFKFAPKLTKEVCAIDWSRDPISIERLIRGLSPFPGAFSKLIPIEKSEGYEIMKIYNADGVISRHSYQYGTIISDNRSYFKVACSGGFVNITDLQLSGKRRMRSCDFLKGFRGISSYKYASL